MSEKGFVNLSTQEAQSFRIESADIEESTESTASLAKDYVVFIINRSQLCLRLARVNSGKWFPIPLICHNCDTDYNTCFAQHRWAPVANFQCNEPAFDLSIVTEPDANGHASGATWRIQPDCNYAGGTIGLE